MFILFGNCIVREVIIEFTRVSHMRNVIAIMVLVVAVALVICARFSRRSDKDIAPKVTAFLYSLLPPVVGNLLIIIGQTEGLSLVGRYLYASSSRDIFSRSRCR